MLRPAVSVADLVRAVRTLRPDSPATIDEIARLLGISQAAVAAAAPGITTGPAPAPGPPAGRPMPSAPGAVRTQRPERSPEPVLTETPALSSQVDHLPPESAIHRPPREIPPLDSLLAARQPVSLPDQETTLLVRQWQRGVLSALISVMAPVGSLDIERIIDQIARRRALQSLPRRSAFTTRKGLQVLVDTGRGMWPYAPDILELEKALRLTAGDDAVAVLRFDRTPASGVGRGTRRHWTGYQPPVPGTPVLVISDFGLAGAAVDSLAATAWQPLVSAAASAGCPLLGLTPFPPARWPAWLSSMFAMVQWDRNATAAVAKRAAKQASRKGR